MRSPVAAAWLEDLFSGGMVCAAAFAYPFFWLLDTGDTTYVWLAFAFTGLLLSAQAGDPGR